MLRKLKWNQDDFPFGLYFISLRYEAQTKYSKLTYVSTSKAVSNIINKLLVHYRIKIFQKQFVVA